MSAEEDELEAAIERILKSTSRKKLVVAGPGTGKSSLFKQMLRLAGGSLEDRLVLTFMTLLQ